MNDDKGVIFKFPIRFIPWILHGDKDWHDALRGECSDFAIVYYAAFLKKGNDPDLKDVAIAMKKMKVRGDAEKIFTVGAKYFGLWAEQGRPPLTSLCRNHFWALVNMPSISELELISLCAYLALRSICRRLYAETTTTIDMIFARIEGKPQPDGYTSPYFERWKSRRQFANIKRILTEVYDVKFKTGKTRGVVFTIGQYSPNETLETRNVNQRTPNVQPKSKESGDLPF